MPPFAINLVTSRLRDVEASRRKNSRSIALWPQAFEHGKTRFMNVAFYSPIKPPDHPVPSGDRTMAKHLIAAMRAAGHHVSVASSLRSYSSTPDLERLQVEAAAEVTRLVSNWVDGKDRDRPDVWFTYHPYYKAPDLIGPAICNELDIPYMTAEASYSSRRQSGEWAATQSFIVEAVRQAAVNFCMTPIDREGLAAVVEPDRLSDLPPFIDTSEIPADADLLRARNKCRLVTVAMMRRGVKFESYQMLATSLGRIRQDDWSLAIIGDGAARSEVVHLFDDIDDSRIEWLGELVNDGVRAELAKSDLFVWPGVGEAYGLAYLEAQACGLPVVALNTHGVPSVVSDGETGFLTPPNDVTAYADAVRKLLGDPVLRIEMSEAARKFVHQERNLSVAGSILDRALVQATTPDSNEVYAS